MKKINRLFICLICLTLALNVIYAEEEQPVVTDGQTEQVIEENKTEENTNPNEIKLFERTKENNYGVNKKYEITSYNEQYILNTPYVDASRKLYDFADILTDEEESVLRDKIAAYIEKTNMDLVIVTLDKDYTEQQNIAFHVICLLIILILSSW